MATEINIAFSVSASGAQPMTFQWQSGSTNLVDTSRITGSLVVTSSYSQSLFINNVQESDTGSYRVVVSNNDGTIASNYAALNIVYHLYPPLVIVQPTDQIVPDGYTASFSSSVIGTPPISYQWYSGSTALVDDGRITGSQTAFLYFSSASYTDTGSYRVYVTNQTASVYSDNAYLNVLNPIITSGVISDSSSINTSLLYGSVESFVTATETLGVQSGLISGSLTTAILIFTGSDSSSLSIGFDSGYITNVIIPMSGSDSGSLTIGFDSGYITNVILSTSGSDSGSLTIGFESGYITTLVIPASTLSDNQSINIGLSSGSLATP